MNRDSRTERYLKRATRGLWGWWQLEVRDSPEPLGCCAIRCARG